MTESDSDPTNESAEKNTKQHKSDSSSKPEDSDNTLAWTLLIIGAVIFFVLFVLPILVIGLFVIFGPQIKAMFEKNNPPQPNSSGITKPGFHKQLSPEHPSLKKSGFNNKVAIIHDKTGGYYTRIFGKTSH
ncbi:MAG: hypothetical protein ABEJ65_03555 [bacterium]